MDIGRVSIDLVSIWLGARVLFAADFVKAVNQILWRTIENSSTWRYPISYITGCAHVYASSILSTVLVLSY